MSRSRPFRLAILALVLVVSFLGGGVSSLLALCGPFTDVSGPFCPSILQIYYLAITGGTTATTYEPAGSVTREQMAAFLSRTYDRAASRTSRRAALDQWWTPSPRWAEGLGTTNVGAAPQLLACDGADVWVPALLSNDVTRVRASDGKVLDTWTGATGAFAAVVAMGRVFVTGTGSLYMIDPTQPGGSLASVANLGGVTQQIIFDGQKLWVPNAFGYVSIVTPGTWSFVNVLTGFTTPRGAMFDGANVWVADRGDNKLKKLDASGGILQVVDVGDGPLYPVFDGTNIWVPNVNSHTVTVVRASDGTVLATLSGNGLNNPITAAFDGQRILVTNLGPNISLFKAASLSPVASITAGIGNGSFGACSDGLNFWIGFSNSAILGRF